MNGLLLLNVKKTVFLTRFCQRAAAEAAAGRLALGIGYRDSSGLTIDECSLAYGVMDESASRVSASSCPPFRFTFRYRCTLLGFTDRSAAIGKFAFGDRTIPIHARTLGKDVTART
jgi:hypothetical protein